MSKLNIKLLRDIRTSPYMFGGIVLLLLVGIALFGSSYALYLNLERSYARSYRLLNLADFTVPVQSAPDNAVDALRRIPGVQAVEGRTVREVEVRREGRERRKVTGRIISLPDTGEPAVNKVKLIDGAYPGPGLGRELLLEAGFANYHGYRPGDSLTVVVEDDEIRFRIAGIVQSAEYIFVVQGREAPYPSESTFSVLWMRRGVVDELFGTAGSVNDIGVTMAPGGNRRSAIRLAERLLKPYGAETAIPQEDQPSVELLRLDLIGLKNLAIFFPILFLSIASLSVYNMLGRMVHAQQGQIGFLRAVGFSRRAVGVHFLLYAGLMGMLGGGLGAGLGHYLGVLVTRFYTSQIQVPYYDVSLRWSIILGGLLISVLVTVISALFPALAAARMTPAEAITTQVPVGVRAPIIERYLPFLRRFSLRGRLPLRNFLRNPRRTFSTVAGVASGAMLLLVATGLLDSTVAAIDFYFKHSISYDITASFLQPQNEFTAERIRRWPGVRRVEPLLAMPAKLTKGDVEQTILVYGIEPDSQLFTLSRPDGSTIPLSPHGVMVAQATAKKLDLWDGAMVRLSLPQQTLPAVADFPETPVTGPPLPGLSAAPSYRERVFTPGRALLETDVDRLIRISGITYQPVGITAYASLQQVREWYGTPLELPPTAINAIAISADPAYVSTIGDRLYDLEGIASVQVIRDIRREIDAAIEQSRVFFNIMLIFSMSLAGVIIFNATLMNVIERTREIATLRTVGLSVGAAARMIWVENLLAYLVGILAGVPLGFWLAHLFVQAYESESFNMQTVIFPRTYLITILSILATVILAQLPGIRYIRGIELTKATKDIG
ncbi:MAG: FtsX-like permease family protein [Armatimonadota bacterium]